MNEFIIDNFKIGDNIIVRTADGIIKGIISSIDNDELILEENGKITVLKGCIFQYYNIVKSIVTDSPNSNQVQAKPTKEPPLSSNTASNVLTNNVIGPKVVGKMDLEILNKMISSNKKKGNKYTEEDIEDNGKMFTKLTHEDGLFPEDGYVKNIFKDKRYCFITDRNNPDIKILLNFNDIIQNGLAEKLAVNMPLRFSSDEDAQKPHAKFAYLDLTASEILNSPSPFTSPSIV